MATIRVNSNLLTLNIAICFFEGTIHDDIISYRAITSCLITIYDIKLLFSYLLLFVAPQKNGAYDFQNVYHSVLSDTLEKSRDWLVDTN